MRTIMRRPWLLVGVLVAAALVAQIGATQGVNWTFTTANVFSPAVPAAGASGDLFEIASTLEIMAGGNVVRGMVLSLTNANHTGGSLYGIDIATIAPDAQADERAINVSSGWDQALRVDDGSLTDDSIVLGASADAVFYYNGAANIMSFNVTPAASADIDFFLDAAVGPQFLIQWGAAQVVDIQGYNAVGTSLDFFTFAPVVSALDGAADLVQGIYIDLPSANHTNGSVYGLAIDNDTEDADAFESAIWLSDEWDGHITMQSFDGAPADNPPAGAIALFIDDNADYSGGGGNDCALVARDAAGAVDTIATLVLNGACP